MHREGVTLDDLPEFLSKLKKYKNINFVGLCSHFADSDNPTSSKFTESQIKQFKHALDIVNQNGFFPQWKHLSASAGSFKIKDPLLNMIRVGKAHYGINPLADNDPCKNRIKLTPVLEFSTTLAQIKRVPKGSFVGYSLTHRTKKTATLGLLPAGYYEGIDRRLSNNGFVKIRDVFCPIVGQVSMNMTVIDISKLVNPQIGEKVIIYSSELSDINSITKT